MKETVAARLGFLERVDLRSAWTSESEHFTPWLALAENIKLLGDTIGIELEVEAEEKNVGPFRADILCKDTANGTWVLIENQLERTDHCHLGQLITYAAGLDAVTIVWIAARFTDEHRAAIDWLNQVTAENILFFALEVELWRIGDSAMAPKFNIVSSPNDWTRSVVQARNSIEKGPLTETQQLYLEFWTYFAEYVGRRKSKIRAPKPNTDCWSVFSIGRSFVSIYALAVARDEWIGVQLTLQGSPAKQYFKLLEHRKNEIEAALGTSLEWREMPDRKESNIRLSRHGVDLWKKENWPEICDWLVGWLEKFDRVFRPIVRDLGVRTSDLAESP